MSPAIRVLPTWLAWIWSIDSFCGRCSAVWEGWNMGWEAVYPSLVEETKGTWQNKPQGPQKSADAHTQFCKKYQRTLGGWYSLVCDPADLHHQYKLITLHQHDTTPSPNTSGHGLASNGLNFTFYKLCSHTEAKENSSQQSRGLCIKGCTGEFKRQWITTDGGVHITLECSKAKSKFSYCLQDPQENHWQHWVR